ncbi:MAG: DJ-1/PfpI family protein, partial [Planctomycetota bacterium]
MLTALLFLTACVAPFAEEVPLAQSAARERTVGILVYEGVELLDFAGPGEAFSAAHGPDGHAFRVVTVASEKRPVVSQGFVTITPAYTLADCPPLAVLVLPGGHVPDDDPALVAWVRERARSTECVMSVCNGAFLVARAGLVDGLEITSHHSALEALTLQFPRVKVLTNRRFVDSGRVLLALTLVEVG